MIAVDSNILVYAHREDSPWHKPADRSLTELAEGASPWAIPWPCVHEFLGIVTHPRIFRPPSPLSEALRAAESWFASPSCHVIGEAEGYWDELKRSLESGRITGPATHDARIFAICRLHGVRELWSADRDFSRFAGVRVVNPLISRR
ncbi:MAG TPA: TA system VapC family ribonuclease toxin [Bryobacteraceae bacterium]|nr:TA system VapC family ribonuclease toxin [Bryobacteraceae bacterium]